jgi:hypothetical protein
VFDVSKGYWLRFTDPKFREEEAETYERALDRWENRRAEIGPPLRQRLYKSYLFYTLKQSQLARWFELHLLPRRPFDPSAAAAYRRHVGATWTVVRALFGSSALIFGLALFVSLGLPEIYLVIRLVLLNALLFLYVVPAMRRASRRIRDEIAAGPRAVLPAPEPVPVPVTDAEGGLK